MNWKQFHKDLDLAMALMIQEENILPSKVSLMDFAEFSNSKRQAEELMEKVYGDKEVKKQ